MRTTVWLSATEGQAVSKQTRGTNKNMGKAFVGEKKRRISKMPVYLADAWCSLPQNNVSMFFKWNFVRLLMRVPIKLHSLQCCGFVYVSRRIKRVWKKNIECQIRHITSCFDATISQSLCVFLPLSQAFTSLKWQQRTDPVKSHQNSKASRLNNENV